MNEIVLQQATVEAVLQVIQTILAIVVVVYILTVVAMWKIFSKAGEKGWKAIIPIYNNYVLYKIAWEPKFFWISFGLSLIYSFILRMESAGVLTSLIMFAIGIAMIYLMAKLCGRLAKSFGRGTGFAVGLFFLPTIFQLILAFGSAEYTKVEE